jgi:hypothetical protein
MLTRDELDILIVELQIVETLLEHIPLTIECVPLEKVILVRRALEAALQKLP